MVSVSGWWSFHRVPLHPISSSSPAVNCQLGSTARTPPPTLRMDFHCDNHPLFRKVEDEAEIKADLVVPSVLDATEEGQKVSRGQGSEGVGKYLSIYERVAERGDAASEDDAGFDFWDDSLSAGGGGDFRNSEAVKQARQKLGERRKMHPVDRARATAAAVAAAAGKAKA